MRVRVKICGITSVEDGLAAAAAGADAIGLVFVPGSPRHLNIETALEIKQALPPLIQTVALFMDHEAAVVSQIVERLQPDLLQFHGAEGNAFCQAFGRPFVKAVAMTGADALQQAIGHYPAAQGLLLDSHGPGKMGGSGSRFPWHLAKLTSPKPLLLAGGLHPANVRAAIKQVQPYAVDVSSGVESAPGCKDPEKMIAFINEVRSV